MKHEVEVEVRFDAAHKLNLPYPSKCNSLHGHTYKVSVIIGSESLNPQGMVVDFSKVKEPLKALDHTYLNDSVQALAQRAHLISGDAKMETTSENLAMIVAHVVQGDLSAMPNTPRVLCVSVSETCTTAARYIPRSL